MQLLRRAFLLTVATMALAGCASRSRGSSDPQATTTLRVENQSFLDMTIYLIVGAQRVRLGQAGGNSTTRLRIPAQYVFGPTPLRFLADPIGASRTPISESITVVPGDEVTLTIPPGA